MAAARGLQLLQSARRVELRRLMRVAEGEEAFTAFLKEMRNTDAEQPVPAKLLSGLHTVSADDLEAQPDWRFAPVGVMSHIERDVINIHQATAFAKHFDLPLVKWRLPLKHTIDNATLRAELYADEPGLWGYFVEGERCRFVFLSRPHLSLASTYSGADSDRMPTPV